ncbi:MAG: autotransporter outer membrane beta-barrel domain-containing protein [Micropepsaceae bacterium]
MIKRPTSRALAAFVVATAAFAASVAPAQACTLVFITQPTILTSPVQCVGIVDTPIAGDVVNDTTVSNTTPTQLTSVFGVFIQNSTISGRFINNGIIDVAAASIFPPAANNQAAFVVGSDIQGGIINNGTIHAAINPALIIVSTVQTGAIDNFGVIRSDGAAVLGFGASAGLYFSGTSFLNTLTNHTGALIQGAEVGVFGRSGTSWTGGIVNAGTIRGGLIGIDLLTTSFSGGITNQTTGLISAGNGSGILVNNTVFAGGLDNAGRIEAFGNLIPVSPFVSGGIGVRMLANNVSGTFYNRATGVVDGTYFGMQFQGSTFNGLFRNAGSILGGDPLETTGFGYGYGAALSYADWTGDIVNEATGTIAARTKNLIVPGTVADNAGLAIGLIVSGNNVTTFHGNVNNAGSIAGPIGVEILVNSFTGNLNNSGSITSETNVAQSSFGKARAVRFIANSFLGDFVNGATGVIRDTSPNAPDAEISTVGINAVSWTGNFRNAGRIENLANANCENCTSSVDIRSTTWTGSFLNEATGVLGKSDEVVHVEVQNFTGNVDNAGHIGDATAHRGMVFEAASHHGEILNRAGAVIEGMDLGLGICGAQCEVGRLNPGDGLLANITNAGRIANTNPDLTRPWAALIVFHDAWIGNLVNEASGVISSPKTAIIVAKHSPLIEDFSDTQPMDLFQGNFINRGTIDGDVDLLIAQWTGNFDNSGTMENIKFAGAMTGGFFNSGTIGSVDLSDTTSALTYRQTGAASLTGFPLGTMRLSNTAVTTLDFRGGRLFGNVIGGSDLNDIFQVNAGSGGTFEYATGIASNLATFAVNSGKAIIGDTEITASSITVGPGATLFMSQGSVVPFPDAILHATNLTLSPTSSLEMQLTTNTAVHPFITVSGTANLAGSFVAHIDPMAFAGTGQTQFVYNGLIQGAVTGSFSSVTIAGAPPLFRITPFYNSFDVMIERLAFTEFADPDSPNQDAVAEALEEIFQEGTSDPDLQNLIDVIAESSSSDIADIYDAIAGSTQAETDLAAQKADDPWKQSVGQRVDAARSTGCTVSGDTWCFRRYAQGGPAPVQTDAPEDPDAFAWLDTGLRDVGATSVWGRIVGVWGETDGGVSSPASRQRTFGFIAGADHVVNSTLLVGVAGQYVRTKAEFENSRNESRVESIQAGAYFSYGGAEAYLNGNVSGIATHSSTNRIFSIGSIDYDAAVRFPATSVTSSLEFGQIYELDGYRIEPHVGVNYAGQFTDAYREHGAEGLGLIVDPDDLHSLRSLVGARASRVYDLGDRKIVPALRLEWRHEYLDRNNTFIAAFQGAPDATFKVSCAPSARDTAVLGTSLTLPISGRVTGYIDAEGAFSEDARSGTISLGARATW